MKETLKIGHTAITDGALLIDEMCAFQFIMCYMNLNGFRTDTKIVVSTEPSCLIYNGAFDLRWLTSDHPVTEPCINHILQCQIISW